MHPSSLEGRRSAFIGLAVVLGLGTGLRLLECPAWSQAIAKSGGWIILPSFDAYGWLAAARCVGQLAGQPLALALQMLTAILPFPIEFIAFILPVLVSPLAAWPMITLLRGLEAPEAGLGAAFCVILTPAYVYRTRLGYCDTDMFLVPLACAALCGLALWRPRTDVSIQGEAKRPHRMDWSWLFPAAALAGLHWLHSGFRPVAAAMGVLFFLSAWPVAKSSHTALASCVAIVLTALGGLWGSAAGLTLCWLTTVWLKRRKRSTGWQFWFFLTLSLVTLAWSLPDIIDHARQSARFFLRPGAFSFGIPQNAAQDVAISVLEAQTLDWQETIRQGAFHTSIGLVAVIAYVMVLVLRPRLLPSLPLAALAALAPMIGIRFALYGGIITGLGLPLGLSLVCKRIGNNAFFGWVLQGLLVVFVLGLAWRDVETFFPVPIITPSHAAALVQLDSLAAPDAQIWTWWDYGYAAQFLAGRRSFADPGNNAGAVLRLISRTLAGTTPEEAAAAMTEGAGGQPPPPTPSLACRFACPDGVRNNAPFPDGDLSRHSPVPGATLPEQYLVVSWEGLRNGRWPLWFASSRPQAAQTPQAWPVLAVSPKRINIDEGWVELQEGVFALSQLDIFQATGGHVQRAWPREKGLAAVLNLGNAELLLFDEASRHSVMARFLIDSSMAFADRFELVIDHAPWVRIYRLRPAS